MNKYNSFRFSNGDRLYSAKPKTRAKALSYQKRRMRKRGVAKTVYKGVRVMYAHMIGG